MLTHISKNTIKQEDERPIDDPISCTSSIYIDWIY